MLPFPQLEKIRVTPAKWSASVPEGRAAEIPRDLHAGTDLNPQSGGQKSKLF